MKVLFCLDGSESSYYAIKKVLPFLRKRDEINLLHVIDWGFLPTYVTFPQEEEFAYPEERNVADKILNAAVLMIESSGFTVAKSDYTHGQPATTLLNVINTEDYDLAVLGSRGKKGIKKWLGSVSRKVVSGSNIPVLIVRPPDLSENIVSIGAKDILFATDGSEYSFNAIRKSIELLNLDDANLTILNIKQGKEALPPEILQDKEWLEKIVNMQEQETIETLEKSELILKEKGFSAQKVLALEGDSAQAILDFTEKYKQDLIVLGSHGRSGLSNFLLGSVSKRVLDNSSCPVLIIPVKRQPHAS